MSPGTHEHIWSSSYECSPTWLTSPLSYRAEIGSALSAFPLEARTFLMGRCGPAVLSVCSTMSPPWFTSAMILSALWTE